MVLGHSECGAIKGACENIKMGNLTTLLKKIKTVTKKLAKKTNFDQKSSDFIDLVTTENVKNVLLQIPKKSKIIRDLIKNNKIILTGAVYDVSSGKVDFN
jgi:carbonic anhydrase